MSSGREEPASQVFTSRLIYEETEVKASLTPPLRTALELKHRGGTESGKHLTTPEPTATATVALLRAYSSVDQKGRLTPAKTATVSPAHFVHRPSDRSVLSGKALTITTR